MIVCVCHRVSEREITTLATQGKGFEAIQAELKVATQCGRCEDCARTIIEQCHAQSVLAPGSWLKLRMSSAPDS